MNKKAVMKLLNDIYRNSEKAHELLPDTFEEIIEFSKTHDNIGRLRDDEVGGGVFLYLYYIPEDKIDEIVKKYVKKHRIHRGSLSFVLLDYTPTSNRKLFEKWVERLKDCESVECLVKRIRQYAKKD